MKAQKLTRLHVWFPDKKGYYIVTNNVKKAMENIKSGNVAIATGQSNNIDPTDTKMFFQ